jgi:predicted DNA-binding mobile mystery protein A
MARFLPNQIIIDHQIKLAKRLNRQSPDGGWIRTIRESLRMSQAELAGRLKINQKSVHDFEVSEINKKIQLKSLEKIATALDCDLIYALIPRTPLPKTSQARAMALAENQLAALRSSKSLEN